MNLSSFSTAPLRFPPCSSAANTRAELGLFNNRPVSIRWNLNSTSHTRTKAPPITINLISIRSKNDLEDDQADSKVMPNGLRTPLYDELNSLNTASSLRGNNPNMKTSLVEKGVRIGVSRSQDCTDERESTGKTHDNSILKPEARDNLGNTYVTDGVTRPARVTAHNNFQKMEKSDANYSKPHGHLESDKASTWDGQSTEKDTVFRPKNSSPSRNTRSKMTLGRDNEVSELDKISGNGGRHFTSNPDDELEENSTSGIFSEKHAGAMSQVDDLGRKGGIQSFRGEDNRNGAFRRSKQNKMKSRQDSLSETATCEKFQMGRELSSEVDFLKLTREPKVGQRTRQESEVEDRGLIGRKSSDRGTLSDQKSLRANSDSDVESRNGRQMLKRSNLIAKQVISKASALSMGFVSQLWVDTSSWTVPVVEIRPSLLSGEMERFFLKDLCQVGDVILVEDENVLENEPTMVGLDSLVGYDIITEDRCFLGKVRDYNFNINLGNVLSLEFDSFGVSFIPASVVSTYCLFTQDVVEVASDKVVVQRGADVRVQRLTKGLWEPPNMHAQEWNDVMVRKSSPRSKEFEGLNRKDYEIERELNLLSEKHMPYKSTAKKAPVNVSEFKDEWSLPMDY